MVYLTLSLKYSRTSGAFVLAWLDLKNELKILHVCNVFHDYFWISSLLELQGVAVLLCLIIHLHQHSLDMCLCELIHGIESTENPLPGIKKNITSALLKPVEASESPKTGMAWEPAKEADVDFASWTHLFCRPDLEFRLAEQWRENKWLLDISNTDYYKHRAV